MIHLGAEFQDMAATRAAELTVAYKTLTRCRAARGVRRQHRRRHCRRRTCRSRRGPGRPRRSAGAAPPPPETTTPPPPPPRKQGHALRPSAPIATSILKRAIAGRVLGIVETLYGKIDTPTVRGFDLAMVPLAKPRFLGARPPRVLVKVVDTADAAAITEAYGAASRARVHAGKSPVVVLLFARTIAPQHELSKAQRSQRPQRKAPDSPEEVAVVVVDTADWSCRLPPGCSAAVHKLTDQICS